MSREGRPRGGFVVVVGPDGVGKTTVAEALLEGAPPGSGYFHFRPPASGRLAPGPARESVPVPKYGGEVSRPMGWVRLAVSFGRFWLGYLRVVRPALRAGGLVVGDRWAYGYIVQPRSLRFGGPEWLARAMVAGLPSPDLVVNLWAPPEVIVGRKHELTESEVIAELESWSRLAEGIRFDVDARADPETIAADVRQRALR